MTDKGSAALLDALVAVARVDLSLGELLQQTIDVARSLCSAQYGALGVIGDEDEIVDFFVSGAPPEMVATIGRLPRGDGVLGELIRNPVPLRLDKLSDHHSFEGIPEGHIEIESFLGAPLMIRDKVFGNIYLAEKEGGGGFGAEDEELLTKLAGLAGVLIERARLLVEHEMRKRMVDGISAVTEKILEEADEESIQQVACEQARLIIGSGRAVVSLAIDGETGFRVIAVGPDGTITRHLASVGRESVSSPYLASAVASHDPSGIAPGELEAARGAPGIAESGLNVDDGESLFTPLIAGGRAIGTMTVIRPKAQNAFGELELRFLKTFADRAAIAIAYCRARQVLSKLAVLEERSRIAKDLHDTVIQQLFAGGMGLQSVLSRIDDEAVTEQIHQTVDILDKAIGQLRTLIFDLSLPRANGQTLESEIADVAADLSSVLGFDIKVRFSGAIDSEISSLVVKQVAAVVREALTNVARHANAASATVDIDTGPSQLTLEVVDDGVGSDDYNRDGGEGTRNFAERAEALGGTSKIERIDGGGTRLIWRVPI